MRLPAHVAGALAFLVLATLNSGGYRFGASDQAFYIPAILDQLDPHVYPRDGELIEPQARYFFVDEIVATVVRTTGLSIEACFAAGYVGSLLLLYGGLWRLGRSLYGSTLATWTLVIAEALRHRITKTGVNTLEGYFHPRVLVFAVGVWALASYLDGRPRRALALVLIAGLVHPTTAAFFVLLLVVAILVSEPDTRRPLGLAAIAGLIGGTAVLLGPLRPSLAPMDPAWQALLSSKDYLFPTRDWALDAWVANLGTACVALITFTLRMRSPLGTPRDAGLLAGAVVLLTGFFVTLPAVAAGSAFFVQLQVSRVFWLLELLAIAGLIGVLVDRPVVEGRSRRWPRAMAAALLLAATVRGGWVAATAQEERPLVSLALPDTDWTDIIDWAENQPHDTHILADPGHAWRYGAPLRYAGRDVFLEDVKDTAMAIYSRESATRVLVRQAALGDFETIDADKALALARQFDLDYLVIDREMDLPRIHQEGQFRVYDLR